jgi:hypothetical protein
MAIKTVLVPQKGARGAEAGDKATFGLVADLAVAQDLTNHYICRRSGVFVDCVVNLKTPPAGANAILDIEISTDDGASWNSVFPEGGANKINLPATSTATVTVTTFAAAPLNIIAPGNLLRINCLQKGSTTPGSKIEVVLRWA